MLAELREIDGSEMETTAAANRRYLHDKLPNNEFIAFLAEAEGETVGTSGLVLWERPPTSRNRGLDGYIMNMYTVPQWRGQGIASALLERLVRCAQEAGARRVFLRAVSPGGKRLYERLGFGPSDTYMEFRP